GTWLNETISFFDEKEQYYHGFLAGLLSGYDAYKLKSNRETGDGRTDLLLMERFDRNIAVVIEVKDVDAQKGETLEMMAEKAIQQIAEKHYTEEPVNEGYQKILRYGIAFMGKRCLIKLG
ncbi:MAG: PD-(D/E)XK nuclease domain-containing protein, partial [Oscillospiraceae bacterium]|nr:PD-(D/E)XK nuclease domain-containing protein [Oscillospiraceae bacterium]